MRIGELAREAGVTTKTVRYYESVGLLTATRLANGYRDYDADAVALVREIRGVSALGIRVEQSRPFLDCLTTGHAQGDDCPDALLAYRAAIAEFDSRIAELTARRDALRELLESASARPEARCEFSPAH
ncbi:MerR family DNA-binding transcriptional regulator [Lysinimonas soli]|uniref:MerR family DNA-binding transcriptional regulator n=1 Tax=Lysinimonas soli TaxID=1074233 RepID=A0ABW0NU08_9MICO